MTDAVDSLTASATPIVADSVARAPGVTDAAVDSSGISSPVRTSRRVSGLMIRMGARFLFCSVGRIPAPLSRGCEEGAPLTTAEGAVGWGCCGGC